nr:HAMP domain-containing protein [uncultured Pseudodesulfovibrio sp.]
MLNNMRLGLKLGLGFGLVLLLTAIVGLVGYRGINGIQARVDKADDVNRVVKYLLEGRIEQLNFMKTKDAQYISKQADIFKKLYDQSTATADKFHQKEDKARMAASADAVRKYEEVSSGYLQLEEQKKGIMEAMRKDADVALEKTKAFRENMKNQFASVVRSGSGSAGVFADRLGKTESAQKMIEWLYVARKDEKEFIITQNPDYLQIHREGVEKILELGKGLQRRVHDPAALAELADVMEAVSGYQAQFKNFVASLQKQNQMGKEMAVIAQRADELCRAIRADQKAKSLKEIDDAVFLSIAVVTAALVLGLLAALFLTRAIAKPLAMGVEFAGTMSDGDLTKTLDIHQKDEVGMLASALNNMVAKLQGVVSDVEFATENVAAGSEELSASSETLSQGATEQAAAIEEVSSSMEQMTANISQNAENARQTDELANKAAADARESGVAVTEAVEAMNSIAEKISIIEEIAR